MKRPFHTCLKAAFIMMFTILLTSCIPSGRINVPEYSYELMARYNDPFSSRDIYFYPYSWDQLDLGMKN
ncbi:MAG: hypothetical protein IJ244_01860, partial [Bacteroidaceae bacterium]|nr:hypothetical protein [Bacteroidaceae bacterium]